MSYCQSFKHRPRKAKFEIKEKDHDRIKVCRECVQHFTNQNTGRYSVRELTWSETKTKTK